MIRMLQQILVLVMAPCVRTIIGKGRGEFQLPQEVMLACCRFLVQSATITTSGNAFTNGIYISKACVWRAMVINIGIKHTTPIRFFIYIFCSKMSQILTKPNRYPLQLSGVKEFVFDKKHFTWHKRGWDYIIFMFGMSQCRILLNSLPQLKLMLNYYLSLAINPNTTHGLHSFVWWFGKSAVTDRKSMNILVWLLCSIQIVHFTILIISLND